MQEMLTHLANASGSPIVAPAPAPAAAPAAAAPAPAPAPAPASAEALQDSRPISFDPQVDMATKLYKTMYQSCALGANESIPIEMFISYIERFPLHGAKIADKARENMIRTLASEQADATSSNIAVVKESVWIGFFQSWMASRKHLVDYLLSECNVPASDSHSDSQWEERLNEKGQVYFVNTQPVGLADEWEERKSVDGRLFYANQKTRKTQWKHPAAATTTATATADTVEQEQ
jgi:hypothetical protein